MAGAGLLGVAAPACSDPATGRSPATSDTASPSDSTAPARRELAAVADVPDGEPYDVSAAAGQPAYLVRDRDSVRLLSATCTHEECQTVWDTGERQFQCPCHFGAYDLRGQVVGGPPPRPLEKLAIVVESGAVYFDG
ncbi:MAG: ubiquinol-cytochrome c reductase iron-sulfur subunit [Actinomycetes bacterium]